EISRRMAKSNTEQLPAKPYEPTKREAAGLEAFERRRKARPPIPSMRAHSKRQPNRLEPDHPDAQTAYRLILESIGTSDVEFGQVVMTQLGKLSIPGVIGANTAEAVNAGLTFIRAVRPQDETEAMLATQMAAIHMATMTAAARLS